MDKILSFLKKSNYKYDVFKHALLITFFILLVFWLVIGTIKFPLDEEFIKNNFIFDSSHFYNNTGQTMQYIVTLVGFILIFPIVYFFARKKETNKFKKLSKLFDILLFLLGVLSVYILSTGFFSFLFLLFVFGILYYFIYTKYDFFDKYVVKHQHIKILLLIIYTSILYIDVSYTQSFFLMHHVTAYYYPIHKILNGLTPFIDFKPLYGCYSYVYALILQFFPQNLHLFVFSIITSLLVFISLFLTYRFLKLFLKDKNKILFVFVSFLICNVYLIYFLENSTYLQYMPHRYMSMVVMMNYIFYYLNRPSIKREIIGFLMCSLMIFWNFDSGLIVGFAYTLFIIYNHICKKKYKNIFLTLLLFLITPIVSFFLIEFLTYIRTGSFVGIFDLLFSTLLFSNSGFLSVKLKLFSIPWIIALVAYLIFLGKSIVNLFENKDKNDSIVFYLSVLGLGIFIYFVERSVLIKFVYIIVPLLFLISNVNFKKAKILNWCCYIFTFVLCFMCIGFSIKFKFFPHAENVQKNQYKQLLSFSEDIGLENFEMYINCDIIYYELLNKKDSKQLPSYVDMFEREDLNHLIDYIERTDGNFIISLDFILEHYNDLMIDKIRQKYYIYYTYDQFITINGDFVDRYVFFIKKDDLKKVSNIDELHKIEDLDLDEIFK